jgi:hypothetical protein
MHFRYLLTILLLISFIINSIAQSKEQYSRLGRRQATWGWIVAGTVPVFTTLAFVVDEPEPRGYVTYDSNISNRTSMFIFAGTAAVVSTVLFVASSKNKKKAASMVMDQRSLIGVYASNGNVRTQTTFSVRIPF